MESNLALAIALASDVHEEQRDKAGDAYILHPLAVMNLVAPDRVAMTTAVLHDVVEDTDLTLVELRIYFPPVVIAALDCLTHRRGETYTNYIERVAGHPVARKVKIADLKHNMDTGRLPLGELTEKDFKRWDKYRRALVRLQTGN